MKQVVKEVGEGSQYNYDEITELVKGNKGLASVIENLFINHNDVVVFESGWKWDVEYDEFAHENLDFKNDENYPGDGWQVSLLEKTYEKLLHQLDGLDEDGNEYEFTSGDEDGFNWDKVAISDDKYVVVADEEDYIAIQIVEPKLLTDGVLDFWEFTNHD